MPNMRPSCLACLRRGLCGPGLILFVIAARGQTGVVINEFLPDPAGSDTGQEFVELLNTSAEPVSLEEMVLEFANGAVSAEWQVRWSGQAGDILDAGRRFLIVDRNWQGEAVGDVEVTLALQNGPDAIRLRRLDTVLDLVGYGPLTDPAMLETEAVPVTAGRSLARRPDGRDTDDNAADFVAADPTPGQVNFQPWAITVASMILEPPAVTAAGQALQIDVVLVNTGTESLPAGTAVLQMGDRNQSALWDGLAPDDTRRISWLLRPATNGRFDLDLLLPTAVEGSQIRCRLGAVQVGGGDLILSEVLASPDRRQGEWIELQVAGDVAVDLAGYRLRDEDGDWHALPDLRLASGGYLILAQDVEALTTWHEDNLAHGLPVCSAVRNRLDVHEFSSGWPTLNNSPPEDRDFADRLQLADSTGCIVDCVVLGPQLVLGGGPVAAGRSLERIARSAVGRGSTNWSVCTGPAGGTPGCINSVSAAGEISVGLTVQPRLLHPAAGVSSVHLRFRLQTVQYGWRARIYDLSGDRVRDLGGDDLGPGPRDLLWDGRDDNGRLLPPGGYIVLLRTHDADGYELTADKVLIAIKTDGGS